MICSRPCRCGSYGETSLFNDVVHGGPLDLTRREPDGTLDREAALTIVASAHPGVYVAHRLPTPPRGIGEYRINPLYTVEADGDGLRLTLKFPNADYEDEYGASRQYLPERAEIDRRALLQLQRGAGMPSSLEDLVRRRVIVALPKNYY